MPGTRTRNRARVSYNRSFSGRSIVKRRRIYRKSAAHLIYYCSDTPAVCWRKHTARDDQKEAVRSWSMVNWLPRCRAIKAHRPGPGVAGRPFVRQIAMRISEYCLQRVASRPLNNFIAIVSGVTLRSRMTLYKWKRSCISEKNVRKSRFWRYLWHTDTFRWTWH